VARDAVGHANFRLEEIDVAVRFGTAMNVHYRQTLIASNGAP
jgi:hypothetical protein